MWKNKLMPFSELCPNGLLFFLKEWDKSFLSWRDLWRCYFDIPFYFLPETVLNNFKYYLQPPAYEVLFSFQMSQISNYLGPMSAFHSQIPWQLLGNAQSKEGNLTSFITFTEEERSGHNDKYSALFSLHLKALRILIFPSSLLLKITKLQASICIAQSSHKYFSSDDIFKRNGKVLTIHGFRKSN